MRSGRATKQAQQARTRCKSAVGDLWTPCVQAACTVDSGRARAGFDNLRGAGPLMWPAAGLALVLLLLARVSQAQSIPQIPVRPPQASRGLCPGTGTAAGLLTEREL